MPTPRTLAVFCVLAACACVSGSGTGTGPGTGTRQEPPSSRDVPPATWEDPGPGRDNPGQACPPCPGAFTCALASGQSVTVATMPGTTGACAFLDTKTDIVVLECGGAVASYSGDVGTWQDDGQGGVIVQLATEIVTCGP